MKKKIKIFLASSITEFHTERHELYSFIESVARKSRDNYGVDIEPFICENHDPCLEHEGRKQLVYNSELQKSDMVFFIFFTKCGEFTLEEFEVAREALAQKGYPKIYTYFKKLSENDVMEDSLKEFMKTLGETIRHYRCDFEHIDTIKLRILLNLKLQELNFIEVKVEDGFCFVDGKRVMSVENVSEFANNQILTELKEELSGIENKYYALKRKADRSKEEADEYAELATKRDERIKEIRELQNNIFEMSMRMCRDELGGKITSRQQEAYRLFEMGDVDGANRILDFEEMKSEYLFNSGMLEKSADVFIKEVKMKIGMLKLMTDDSARFDKTENLYDEVVPVALRTGAELDVVLDCIWFLRWQNKHKKAVKIGKKLELFYDLEENSDSEKDKAKLLRALATLYCEMPYKEKEAEEYIDKAELPIRLNVLSEYIMDGCDADDPYKFRCEMGYFCNMAGSFYMQRKRLEEAENHFREAIDTFEKLAEENPEKYNSHLAGSYNNMALLYCDFGILDKADLCNAAAVSIREKLAEDNSIKHYSDLSGSYNNTGNVKAKNGDLDWAEHFYLEALDIREALYCGNPQGYADDLATTYGNIAIVYERQDRKEEAEEYYLKATELYENMVERSPERFDECLAISYMNTALFYDLCKSYEKAEYFYIKAIEITEKLAEKSPEKFLPYLAKCCFAYAFSGELKEEYFEKAIEIIDTMPDHPSFKEIVEFLDEAERANPTDS